MLCGLSKIKLIGIPTKKKVRVVWLQFLIIVFCANPQRIFSLFSNLNCLTATSLYSMKYGMTDKCKFITT